MLDQRQHVPVLRWKQTERLALRHLSLDVKRNPTPIIELTPAILAKHGSPLLQVVDELSSDWGHGGVFLDLQHLGPDEIDLVLDAGIADESQASLAGVASRLGTMAQWRSLTVTAGAFPKDLQG